MAPFPGQLIVHVGDHKAGSSTIQAVLARGDVRLKSGTLCYPLDADRWNHNHLKHAFEIVPPRRRYFWKRREPGPFAPIAAIARAAQPDVTLLSGESFEWIEPAAVKDELAMHFALAEDALQLITYVRPHYPRLLSSLAEQIKIGWAGENPAEHLDENFDAFTGFRLTYAPRLDSWREVFGTTYTVRPMIRSELASGDLLTDLFETCLGPDQVDITQGASANESLSLQDLMRLHVLHRAAPDLKRWDRHAVGWALAQILPGLALPSDEAPERIRGSRALAIRTRDAFLEDAKAVDQAWFGGRPLLQDDLDKAVDTAPEKQQSLAPEDWLSGQEIRTLQAFGTSLHHIAKGTNGWQKALRQNALAVLLGRDTSPPDQ